MGVRTSPPFENMGIVIRPNMRRNSESGRAGGGIVLVIRQ